MSIDDPNTISGEQSICATASRIAGRVPLGGELVGFLCSRYEARKNYITFRRMLLRELRNSKPDQEQVIFFAAKLTQTANYGAQRANFRSYFIDGNRDGPLESVNPTLIRKLPEDPDDIMYGFWG